MTFGTQPLALMGLLSLCCFPAGAGENYRVSTLAGELVITPPDEDLFRNVVTLNRETIVATTRDDDAPIVTLLAFFPDMRSGPFRQIALLQYDVGGNACDGGPFQFLGIDAVGKYQLSEKIDFCGGPAPTILWKPDSIAIHWIGHRPNHGDGWIPGKSWEFADGKIRPSKQAPAQAGAGRKSGKSIAGPNR